MNDTNYAVEMKDATGRTYWAATGTEAEMVKLAAWINERRPEAAKVIYAR